MRFPLLAGDRDTDRLLADGRKRMFFFNDGWRKRNIVPPDTDQAEMEYEEGSCPVAEQVAEEIVNLPTSIHIGRNETDRIIKMVREWN